MFAKKLLRDTLLRPFRRRPTGPVRRADRVFGRPVEGLEDRTVPTVTVNFNTGSGTLTFTGDGNGDTVLIQSTATAGSVQYNAGGLGLTTQPGVNAIIYNAAGGNDVLVVANPGGNIFTPATPGTFNITFNGGGDAADELDFVGGAATWTGTYTPTGTQAGTVTFRNDPGTQVESVAFTGTPTVRNSMTALNMAVTTPGSNDTINVGIGPNLTGIASVSQGPAVIDGGDRDDHGSFTGGANQDGWKFIEQSLNFLNQTVFNAGAANSVLVVGTTASTQARNAVVSAAGPLGLNLTFVTGAQIAAANFNNFRIIYVPSDANDTAGGISQADKDALAARTADIRDFVNAGGGLFALTEQGLVNPFNWLQIPNPFAIVASNNDTMVQTPALAAAGFNITNAELTNGTPVHNAFTGPPGFNNLDVFVNNGTNQVITLGHAAIQNQGGYGGGGPSTDITFNGAFPRMYVNFTAGLTLDGAGGSDAYNIQLGTPGIASIGIAESGATAGDIATLFGTPGADTMNVNTAAAKTIFVTGPVTETLTYTAGLETLVVHSSTTPADPNPQAPAAADAADTYFVTPDATTAITVNGGRPVNTSPGDTLFLSAIGLTGAVVVDNQAGGQPAYPNGRLTSGNRQTVTWNSMETVPVPIGLGGTFDFQPSRPASPPYSPPAADANTQPGFIPITPADTTTSGLYPASVPLSFPGVGWVNPGAGAFDRPAVYGPVDGDPGGPLNKLLYDGEWGWYGGGANDGVFQVAVAPNNNVMVTVIVGDVYAARDTTDIFVGNPTVGFTQLNTTPGALGTTIGPNGVPYLTYSGMFNPGASNVLQVRASAHAGGSSTFWTISGVDVRPEGLIAPLTLTRVLGTGQAGPLQTNPLVADGLAVDYYRGIGAAPNAVLTVEPQYGTPVDADGNASNGLTPDAYAKVAGFQIVAAADGSFDFGVRRPTGSGPSYVSVRDATGASATGLVGPNAGGAASATPNPYVLPGSLQQTLTLPTGRRIDFGPATTPVASDLDPANPNYIGFGGQSYISTAANALGWLGTPAQAFDRGAAASALQRDGVFNPTSTPGDFLLDLPTGTYSVTVLLGDPGFTHDQMFVQQVDSATGATVLAAGATGLTVPAGQSTPVTFTVTTDANAGGTGRVRLRFGTASAVQNAFWAVQALEVRPTQGALTITSTTPGARPADGTTTTYTITGATPGALITVSTTFGSVATADGATTYTGSQVVATNPAGTATFTITSPTSASTLNGAITASETTGLKVGTFAQQYTGVVPASPPPAAAVYQGFDFGTATSPLAFATRVTGGDLYTPSRGNGWAAGVGDYDRAPGSFPTPAGVNSDLYRDGAWGTYSPGTFQVSVPNGTYDVRVYVGDPYGTWPNEVVTASGGAASTSATSDQLVSRYGYVTLYGVSVTSGVLSVSIGSATLYVWTAAGVEVATAGNLPTPLVAPASPPVVTLSAPRRLDFDSGSPTAAGFTSASTALYAPTTTGYGWQQPVNAADRGTAGFPVGFTAPALYRDFAWGQGTAVFEVAVPTYPAAATYDARVYVGDTYSNWGGITLQIEGGSPVAVDTAANPFWSYRLLGGKDANGDGVLTITVNGPIWVVNGIDVAPAGSLPASAGPAGSPQLAAGGAVAGGTAAVLSADQLAPVAAEAVRRWEAAGATPAQLAALRGVRFAVADLGASGRLGETSLGGNLVTLDDDGAGRGWFVDATPGDDAEFGGAVASTERAGGVAGYDLLTVVMHEMGHTIRLDSLDAGIVPHDLMTPTLGTGTRRVPAAAAWAADAPVNLWVDAAPVEAAVADAAAPVVTPKDGAAALAPPTTTAAALPTADLVTTATPAWPDDEWGLGGVKVG